MPDADSTPRSNVVVWSSFTVSLDLRLHFHDPQLDSGYLSKQYYPGRLSEIFAMHSSQNIIERYMCLFHTNG